MTSFQNVPYPSEAREVRSCRHGSLQEKPLHGGFFDRDRGVPVVRLLRSIWRNPREPVARGGAEISGANFRPGGPLPQSLWKCFVSTRNNKSLQAPSRAWTWAQMKPKNQVKGEKSGSFRPGITYMPPKSKDSYRSHQSEQTQSLAFSTSTTLAGQH